jgi:hypothetical protein
MITKIPKEKQLIIFDFYDTIIYSVYHNQNFLRNGIKDLVNRLDYEGKILTISSDVDISDVVRDFGYSSSVEFIDKFRKIYGIDIIKFDITKDGFKKYKDLGIILDEYNIPLSKAIFIGDNYQGVDEYSANKFGMDYIIVPRENKDFSFISLLS